MKNIYCKIIVYLFFVFFFCVFTQSNLFAQNKIVAGAGTTACNGTYAPIAPKNGKSAWKHQDSNHYIFYEPTHGTYWVIHTSLNHDAYNSLYYVESAAEDPPENGWAIQGGISPAPGSVTPVELTNFTAMQLENAVKLLWQTATEVNNYGFQVERASFFGESGTTPIREWEAISFVEGHGNSNSPKTYQFIDESEFGEEEYYYRLKQIDTDGSFEYSDVVKVSISTLKKFALNQNYPNPFNPTTAIKFVLPVNGMVNLTVYNLLGQEVAVLINREMTAGSYEKEFDADNLPSGTYIYRITVGNKFKSERKMIVLK